MPRVDEGNEDEEGVSRECHDQGQVQRVEENEDEEEREEDLISQQQAPLLGIVFVDLPLVKMSAHQVPNDLDRVCKDHGDNSDFKSEQKFLFYLFTVLIFYLDCAHDPWVCNGRRLASIFGVEADKLVSESWLHVNALRTVITQEIWVFTVSAVAEARVSPDLPVWLSRTHLVVTEVKNVALATLIVAQSRLPLF